MNREEKWQREWEVLRAEREVARRRLRRAAEGLSAWSRDPLGIAGIVRGHPIAATGAATGLGAVLGALLGRFLPKRDPEPGPGPGPEPAAPAAPWGTILREAVVGLAVPWLLRVVGEKFRGDPGAKP